MNPRLRVHLLGSLLVGLSPSNVEGCRILSQTGDTRSRRRCPLRQNSAIQRDARRLLLRLGIGRCRRRCSLFVAEIELFGVGEGDWCWAWVGGHLCVGFMLNFSRGAVNELLDWRCDVKGELGMLAERRASLRVRCVTGGLLETDAAVSIRLSTLYPGGVRSVSCIPTVRWNGYWSRLGANPCEKNLGD